MLAELSTPALVYGFLLLLGGAFVYVGVRDLRPVVASFTSTARTVGAEPVEPGQAPDDGTAIVTGRIRPGSEGSIETPVSGTDAVGYRYRIRQRTDGVGWWTVDSGSRFVPFELVGATGRAHVDPGTAVPPADDWDRVAVDADEELPEGVRQRVAASDTIDTDEHPQLVASAADEPRRYEEAALRTGERVTVTGTASSAAGDHDVDLAVDETAQTPLVRESALADVDAGQSVGADAARVLDAGSSTVGSLGFLLLGIAILGFSAYTILGTIAGIP